MIALLPILLLIAPAPPQTTAQVQPPPTTSTLATPPSDWTGLPPLAYLRPWPNRRELSTYVRTEVRAKRCAATGATLKVDLAVLVAAGGQVRRIVPRAIDCPTVEQYASGLVSRMARSNVPAPAVDTWYHAAIVFTLG